MSMTIGMFDAKTRFSEIVESVAATGESITITRRGKAVARIVPAEPGASAVEDALALLLEIRANAQPGTDSLRDLIDHGRHV